MPKANTVAIPCEITIEHCPNEAAVMRNEWDITSRATRWFRM